jgi:hypothetical protein
LCADSARSYSAICIECRRHSAELTDAVLERLVPPYCPLDRTRAQRKAGSRNPIKPDCGSGPLLAGSDSEERASAGLENQIGADSPVIAGGMSTLLPRAAVSRVSDAQAACSRALSNALVPPRMAGPEKRSMKSGCGCGPIAHIYCRGSRARVRLLDRHQALQLVVPVEDNDNLSRCSLLSRAWLHHQKASSVA